MGPQNLIGALAWSNDVYFYKLGLMLGPERIHEIGTALGVDLGDDPERPAPEGFADAVRTLPRVLVALAPLGGEAPAAGTRSPHRACPWPTNCKRTNDGPPGYWA